MFSAKKNVWIIFVESIFHLFPGSDISDYWFWSDYVGRVGPDRSTCAEQVLAAGVWRTRLYFSTLQTLKLDVNKHTIIQSGSRTLCRTLDCWFCSEEKLLVFQSSLKPLSETIKRAAGCRVSGAATCSCTVSDCASWALTDRVILGLNLHHLLI